MNNVVCGVLTEDFPVKSSNKGNKQPYRMTPKGVVAHNTWNTAKAKSEASYMVGNSMQVSFHSVVDDQKVIECIPFNYNAWHCGNQYGNRNYIGVEIAKSKGDLSVFKNSEINGAKYIAGILRKYNWGIDKLYSHQNMSGKYCPHRTLDLGWERFKRMVANELKSAPSKNPNAVPNSPSEYLVSDAKYSVKTNTPNDDLSVREYPRADSKKISSYSDGSVIYVEKVYKSPIEGVWYKIPRVGYVSAKCCVGIPNKKPADKPVTPPVKPNNTNYSLVVYDNEVDRAYARDIEVTMNIPAMHLEDYSKVQSKYPNIIFVGGSSNAPKDSLVLKGANRNETKIAVSKFIDNNK